MTLTRRSPKVSPHNTGFLTRSGSSSSSNTLGVHKLGLFKYVVYGALGFQTYNVYALGVELSSITTSKLDA
ncbi:hypothetical protein L6164_003883 [Bauhinia variegata]|uniref:Uncharacterized protein n=1 Tax=Bauhinia variegata TaxID=167791 RepID=A0ACB9Q2P2_BAUVA|nr:hypothetical protein L6164_003883 [Bauhinia variegata]